MTAENVPPRTPRRDTAEVSWRELARQQGVTPALSLDDMARPALFESDDELDAFLHHLAASRHADTA